MTDYIAYHEAGHAVAMFFLGIPILTVELGELEAGAAGGVKPVPGGCSDRFKHAVADLAGHAAVVRYIDSNFPDDERATIEYEAWQGAVDDSARAMAFALDRYTEAEAEAVQIVEQRWMEIALVAGHLVNSGRLSGVEVAQLLTERP